MTTIGEDMVDAIMWYAAGPYSEMPASIAALEPTERDRRWKAAENLFREKGEDYAVGVAEAVAEYLMEQKQ